MGPDALSSVGLSAEVALFTNFFQLKIDEENNQIRRDIPVLGFSALVCARPSEV